VSGSAGAEDRGDSGGIVTSWLLKVVLSLLLLGMVAFEAGAIVIARIGVDGTAQTAATEAAFSYARNQDLQRAETEAADKARQGGATLVAFAVSEDGETVTVTLERTARTMIVHRISSLERFSRVTATARARVT
jgi:hypothetical protein